MLSYRAYETILGIKEKVKVSDEEMADSLNITFFPYSDTKTVNARTLEFAEKLKGAFTELKINVVPYEEALEIVPLQKTIVRTLKIFVNNILFLFERFYIKNNPRIFINFSVIKNLAKRHRVKKGISVVAVGESATGNLPMDNTSSFRDTSVITLVDWPEHIAEASQFEDHFDTAMSLFAHHMTNIVIAVSDDKWLLYNFNASHPVYDIDQDLNRNILHGLIPKIAAPIRPVRLKEFTILKEPFDPSDSKHEFLTKDLVESSRRFQETGLYPKGKKIDDLPFRNDFYRWIGKIHLDERSGMSFGFLAVQMPTALYSPIPLNEAEKKYGDIIPKEEDFFFDKEGNLHILVKSFDEILCIQVPEVWVLSQRSGSNKTNMDPQKDLVKLGLKNGAMYLQTPQGLKITSDYKTSFDTQVILAHAVGNAIVASLLSYKNRNHEFVQHTEKKGFAIAHWHGYFKQDKLPNGWFLHGTRNPNVACSSPQSAIYAIEGKLNEFNTHQEKQNEPIAYKGDIHIEPHHGTNIIYQNLDNLVTFLLDDKERTTLGNKYLSQYTVN